MTPITISAIQIATAEHFGVRLDHLLSARRDRVWARPRQVAMYLACQLTDKSTTQIGRAFRRDHSTAIYARDLIADFAKSDNSIAKAIDDISRQLLDDPRQITLPLVA